MTDERTETGRKIEAAVEKARQAIISGAVKVHNYEDDSNCPF